MRPTSRRSCVGFVSHMFFHCHEMRLHCLLLSVAWFQLALISSHCFESFLWLDRLPAEVPWKRNKNVRLFPKSRDHPQWRSGYVRSGQTEGTGFKSRYGPSFSLLPFFFLFCFVLFADLFCCFFLLLLLFLNIYLNNC